MSNIVFLPSRNPLSQPPLPLHTSTRSLSPLPRIPPRPSPTLLRPPTHKPNAVEAGHANRHSFHPLHHLPIPPHHPSLLHTQDIKIDIVAVGTFPPMELLLDLVVTHPLLPSRLTTAALHNNAANVESCSRKIRRYYGMISPCALETYGRLDPTLNAVLLELASLHPKIPSIWLPTRPPLPAMAFSAPVPSC